MSDPVKTPYSRVFVIENRAGPANAPDYKGQSRVLGPSWSFGDRTPVREPDPGRYGAFRIIEAIKGQKGLPMVSLEYRFPYTLDEFLALARVGCPFDIQIHFGKCQDPRDVNDFSKIIMLDGADISNFSASEMGAFDSDQEAMILGTIATNSLDLYEIVPIVVQAIGGAEVVQEVVAVVICDSVQCGICGIASNGCQTFFAITLSSGGSPGLPAEIIYSNNGGTTLGQTNIDTIGANEDPSDAACVGTNLVVISNESGSLHYAPIADIIDGVEVWVEVTTGFVAPAGAPNAIFSLGADETWIVGAGGYVYSSEDITASVIVQDAGVTTIQPLNDIHGLNSHDLIAVGNLNVILRTQNGGDTWTLVTGPAAGVALNTCWMRSAEEWFVGAANGRLYYTRNAGLTWTEKAFPGSGSGAVEDIKFSTPSVGVLSHTLAGVGRILRTVTGGHSWYVLPEGAGTIPDNDRINAIAVCGEDPNRIYAGGLGANAVDGILLRGA